MPRGVRAPGALAFAARQRPAALSFQRRLALPVEAVEEFYRLPIPGEVTVIPKGQRAAKRGGDYLFVWPADRWHKTDTWWVKLRPARNGRKARWCTGCGLDDLAGAIQAYLEFLREERQKVLGRRQPKALLVTDVVGAFLGRDCDRLHRLARIDPDTVAIRLDAARRALPFVDGLRVGAVTKCFSADYMAWATRDKAAGGGGFAHNTGVLDLSTLRLALETELNDAETYYRAPFELPAWEKSRIQIFSPAEMDRIPVCAETGRIWDAAAGDWARRIDPATGISAFDLRPPGEAEAALACGRQFQLGVWFGSRIDVHLGTKWINDGSPWIDLDGRILHRLGSGKEETSKRRGYCDIPEAALPILAAWRDADTRRGCAWVIHTPDGRPLERPNYRAWYALLAAAGARRLNPHVCRHTCVQILKLAGVSLWEAAEYLFLWPHTIVSKYGEDWDRKATVAAAHALSDQRAFRERWAEEERLRATIAAAEAAHAA